MPFPVKFYLLLSQRRKISSDRRAHPSLLGWCFLVRFMAFHIHVDITIFIFSFSKQGSCPAAPQPTKKSSFIFAANDE